MAELSQEEMRDRLGNLDQIRELLFGQKSQEYNDRIGAIESDFAKFQEQMEERLTQMQKELSNEIKDTSNAFEKQLKYLRVNAQEDTSHLGQSIEENHKRAMTRINALEQTLSSTSNSLRSELSQTKAELKSDLTQLKQEVNEEIERHFGQLGETKVSRDDFAEVLFNMCLQIKGSDFLDQTEADKQQSDYLLPDSPNEEEK